jgi:peptidyl-dipeptidase Dcp
MSSFRDQQRLIGDIKPVVYNVCNYTKAPAGQPNLLSLDDVITLFHEFGHALHGMLSDVTYPSQSGTSVKRDFVEFPSQLMEHWVTTPEILTRFAKHHATGEVIPRSLVDKIIAAKNFNQGWATSEFMMAAIMDMKMHMIEGPAPTNVDAWEDEILSGIGSIPEIVVRYRPGYFKHTFEGGYAAGYYSYIWAAVLECDAFQAFVDAGNVYDPATSKKLKDFIFASGGQADPMDNYIAFRGRAPGVEALLQDRDLTVS